MRGKHGESAAVRHEVQDRDKKIAELTRERDRARTELAAAKERIADYQTKLGAWTTEENERIQQHIRDSIVAATAKLGNEKTTKDGLREYSGAGPLAYERHMMTEHGMELAEARTHVIEHTRSFGGREERRRAARRLDSKVRKNIRTYSPDVEAIVREDQAPDPA